MNPCNEIPRQLSELLPLQCTGATQLFIIDKINDDHKYVIIMIRVITMAILTTSRSTN